MKMSFYYYKTGKFYIPKDTKMSQRYINNISKFVIIFSRIDWPTSSYI